MASIIYDSMMEDLVRGAIDFDTDSFFVMLVTDQYTPSKGTHKTKSQVGFQVGTTGTNYAEGGLSTTVTPTLDTVNHRLDLAFSNVTWSNATITAKGAVIYKKVGSDASAMPLVAYVDFGQNVSSTAAAFAVTFSSSLRFQN
jgi:hypothetical protein